MRDLIQIGQKDTCLIITKCNYDLLSLIRTINKKTPIIIIDTPKDGILEKQWAPFTTLKNLKDLEKIIYKIEELNKEYKLNLQFK